MIRIGLIFLAAMLTAGCEHFAAPKRVTELAPGMTQVDVLAAVGAPDRRQVRDGEEAWEYCINGLVVDDYLLVRFEDGKATATAVEPDLEFGHCQPAFDAFRWEEAPPPS